jgi:CysZ protein
VNVFQQFRIGISSYWAALKMIFATTMWLSFAIPIILSIGLYYGGDMLTDNLRDYKFGELSDDNGSEYLLLGIQFISVYVTKFMNKYLVLSLLSPLLAFLSVEVEYLLTGNRYPWNWEYYGKDVVRALMISFRNMGIQLMWMAGYFILNLFFGFPDWVHTAYYLVIAFYFYGFSFMDYASERRRLTVSESVAFTRKHWVAAYVLGGVYGGLFQIPSFGMALEPAVVLAPILGVVAGTIVVHKIVDLGKNPYAIRPGADVPDRVRNEPEQVPAQPESAD